MAEMTRTHMTAAEFFKLPETTQPTELIEGVLIVSPSPAPLHQLVSGGFYTLLKNLIPDGKLFYAPMDVYFDDDNILQPDVIWVAENSQCVIGEKRLAGPPDLIVEVFSPGTATRDKREKYRLYERYGVREYWMVDPVGQYVEVYRLVDGRFIQQGVYGPGESFDPAVLDGKTVHLGAVFAV